VRKLEQLFGVDLRSLAALRICLAIILLVDLGGRSFDLAAHYTDAGVLPRTALIGEFSSRWILSLHLMNGTPQVQALLFVVAGLFALLLLVGHRTRFATIVSWFLLISLHNRNALVITGGDVLLRLILFWSIFLPLGARASVDAALNTSEKRMPERVLSVGTVAILAQVVMLYTFTALHKFSPEWRVDASAIYYALSIDQMVRPFGLYLLNFPEFLRFLTRAVLAFEFIGPVLLFVPIYTSVIRVLLVGAFAIMHAGFGFSMSLGLFPWVSAVAMLPFLPSGFWNAWLKRLQTPERLGLKIYYDGGCAFCKKSVLLLRTFLWLPDAKIHAAQEDPSVHADMETHNSWVLVNHKGERLFRYQAVTYLLKTSPILLPLGYFLGLGPFQGLGDWMYERVATHRGVGSRLLQGLTFRPLSTRCPLAVQILCGFFLVYVFMWNLGTVKDFKYRFPNSLRPVGRLLQLGQSWRLFAPYPRRNDGWYVMPGRLRNGREVDVFRGGNAVDWEKPERVSEMYPNFRWRKYMMAIWRKKYRGHRRYYARYVCREWNRSHSGDERLDEFDVFFMNEKTLPDYQVPKVKKVYFGSYKCP